MTYLPEEAEPGLETEPEPISCEVCMKEIPASEAQSAEAEDYVAFFCGLECFEQWEKAAKSMQP